MRTAADGALRAALGVMLFFPSREVVEIPEVEFDDVEMETEDGERLHGWWMPARRPTHGHLLFFHGNGGNVGERAMNASLLANAGFDVLLIDYRGYGRSSGRPSEEGTYADARAARAAMLGFAGVDPARLFYLGESLGGAVALRLAVESPPLGLILQSTFTSIRDVARLHYRFIPGALVPDAYPSLRLIRRLDASLLVLHGDRDAIVPLSHGRALYDAAPVARKAMHVFEGRTHDDLVALSAREYERLVADWAGGL